MHDLKQAFLPMFGAMAVVGMLLLKEPDFGAFVVIISIAMGILFLGGLRPVCCPADRRPAHRRLQWSLIVVSPYRRDRIFGFMDPWADAVAGYQLSHSLIAFGRGELFGVGLGASVEKTVSAGSPHRFPALAVIAEELGFLPACWSSSPVRPSSSAPSPSAPAASNSTISTGAGRHGHRHLDGVQSFINMGSIPACCPTRGLTLPLMSFGGSGILANCALAILLVLIGKNRRLMRGGKLRKRHIRSIGDFVAG